MSALEDWYNRTFRGNEVNPNYNPQTGSSAPNGGTYLDAQGNQIPLTFQQKADGGYDFFVNGQPASIQDYQAAGGQLPAGVQLQNGTTTPSTNPNNPPILGPAIPAGFGQTQPTQPVQTGGSTGGSASGGTTPVLGSTTFYNPYTGKTTTYNLDDPTQAGAFYNDKLSALQSKRDEEVSKGKKSSDKQIADLNTQLNDTYQEAKGYVDTYLTNVNEFGDQYQMGNVKRQQFFAGLSPNAFQSSQGTSQDFAQNKYIEGLGAYAKEANQNVGSAFLANAQANPNTPDYSTLDTNSAFGRNVAGIKGAQQDIATAFNDFVTQANQNVNQQAADTSTSLKAIDQYGKTVDPLAKATLNQVNNSAITPYTTFQQGGAQAPVQGTAPVTYGTTPINTQAPLDQFLGTNRLSSASKDYLSSWLKSHS